MSIQKGVMYHGLLEANEETFDLFVETQGVVLLNAKILQRSQEYNELLRRRKQVQLCDETSSAHNSMNPEAVLAKGQKQITDYYSIVKRQNKVDEEDDNYKKNCANKQFFSNDAEEMEFFGDDDFYNDNPYIKNDIKKGYASDFSEEDEDYCGQYYTPEQQQKYEEDLNEAIYHEEQQRRQEFNSHEMLSSASAAHHKYSYHS